MTDNPARLVAEGVEKSRLTEPDFDEASS